MNELVAILDSALRAGLGKRQWAVFAAVLRQTLGYRKSSDDLSAGRLAQLTGIQRNHIWQAKQELVDKGLLVSKPGKFGEVLGFAVLHEKLTGLAATDSGYAMQPSATDSVQARTVAVRPSVSATNSGMPEKRGRHVLPEPPASPPPPDLGVPASQFGTQNIPKQDTSQSNQTQSNHNNRPPPLPTRPAPERWGVAGVPVVVGTAGVSATDSGLHPPSVPAVRSSATDSGCPTADPSGALEWPANLETGMRQAMAGLLCGLAMQTAQSVLDVLAMGLEAGKVRKPLAYLRVLVRSAHNGQLATTEAHAWREQRSRGRAPPVSPAALERAGELAWLRQMATLQGLPIELVAAQLGVKGWQT